MSLLGKYPAIVWKVFWSSNGYRGWDHVMYRAWLFGKRSGYDYVARYGFGHEWWNFYESFSNEYYYGYAPPIHAIKPRKFRNGGAIFFISKHPRGSGWHLVGVYGYVEVLEKPIDVGVLWDYVPEQCKSEIRESTRKKLAGEDLSPLESPTYFTLRARKDYSTPMPRPIPINLPEDVGVKFLGTAAYKYLELNRALALLDKAIEYASSFIDMGEMNKKGLWAHPAEVVRRLRRLRKHLVRLTGPPMTIPQQPELTTHFLHPQEKLQQEHYLYYTPAEIPERFIEETLAQNLEVIEEGLRLVGRQVYLPDTGRVDILAYDKHGSPVVIEVKSGIADDSTLAQLLAYMSKIKEKEGKTPRGVIVAEEFTKKLQHAVKLLNNVKLVKIAVRITIEKLEEM